MAGPKGGRPAVGPQVAIAIPPDMLAAIDECATAEGVSRAEWVRRACADKLSFGTSPSTADAMAFRWAGDITRGTP